MFYITKYVKIKVLSHDILAEIKIAFCITKIIHFMIVFQEIRTIFYITKHVEIKVVFQDIRIVF